MQRSLIELSSLSFRVAFYLGMGAVVNKKSSLSIRLSRRFFSIYLFIFYVFFCFLLGGKELRVSFIQESDSFSSPPFLGRCSCVLVVVLLTFLCGANCKRKFGISSPSDEFHSQFQPRFSSLTTYPEQAGFVNVHRFVEVSRFTYDTMNIVKTLLKPLSKHG